MWNIFKKKTEIVNNRHKLDDLDRIDSAMSRMMKARIRKMESELWMREMEIKAAELEMQLRELQGDDEEDQPDGLEQQFIQMAMQKIQNPQSAPALNRTGAVTLSDEQITGLLPLIPEKYLKQLSSMNPDAAAAVIQRYIPTVNQETCNRIATRIAGKP